MTKTTKTFASINEVLTVIDGLVTLHTLFFASDWYNISKPELLNTPLATSCDDLYGCCFTFIIREHGFDSRFGLKGMNIDYLKGLNRSGIAIVGNLSKTSNGYELKLNTK